jgi:hypothetical protein
MPVSIKCYCDGIQKVGGPILLNVKVGNLSHNLGGTFEIEDGDDYVVELYRNGLPVALTAFGTANQKFARKYFIDPLSANDGPYEVSQITSVRPLEEVGFVIDLSSLFQISEPGDYVVVVRRSFGFDSGSNIVIGASEKFTLRDNSSGKG